MKVEFTNGIPICPNCQKSTRRQHKGSTSTLMNYQPIYDENGNNINPDRNISTSYYDCLDCDKNYCVKGNHFEGFKYA